MCIEGDSSRSRALRETDPRQLTASVASLQRVLSSREENCKRIGVEDSKQLKEGIRAEGMHKVGINRTPYFNIKVHIIKG